jgi:hypothetical protein
MRVIKNIISVILSKGEKKKPRPGGGSSCSSCSSCSSDSSDSGDSSSD